MDAKLNFGPANVQFVMECPRCTRRACIGAASITMAQKGAEMLGWVQDGDEMICPRCPAPREQVFNRAREEAKRARREAASIARALTPAEFSALYLEPFMAHQMEADTQILADRGFFAPDVFPGERGGAA